VRLKIISTLAMLTGALAVFTTPALAKEWQVEQSNDVQVEFQWEIPGAPAIRCKFRLRSEQKGRAKELKLKLNKNPFECTIKVVGLEVKVKVENRKTPYTITFEELVNKEKRKWRDKVRLAGTLTFKVETTKPCEFETTEAGQVGELQGENMKVIKGELLSMAEFKELSPLPVRKIGEAAKKEACKLIGLKEEQTKAKAKGTAQIKGITARPERG
jgi:hypothetical protein